MSEDAQIRTQGAAWLLFWALLFSALAAGCDSTPTAPQTELAPSDTTEQCERNGEPIECKITEDEWGFPE